MFMRPAVDNGINLDRDRSAIRENVRLTGTRIFVLITSALRAIPQDEVPRLAWIVQMWSCPVYDNTKAKYEIFVAPGDGLSSSHSPLNGRFVRDRRERPIRHFDVCKKKTILTAHSIERTLKTRVSSRPIRMWTVNVMSFDRFCLFLFFLKDLFVLREIPQRSKPKNISSYFNCAFWRVRLRSNFPRNLDLSLANRNNSQTILQLFWVIKPIVVFEWVARVFINEWH